MKFALFIFAIEFGKIIEDKKRRISMLSELKKKLEKNLGLLKITKDLYTNHLKSYNHLKSLDDGTHSDFWKKIERSKKSLDVLERNYLYCKEQVELVEKEISKIVMVAAPKGIQ